MTDRETEVLGVIRQILVQQLEYPESVAAEDRLGDCAALDSLGLITVAVGLEDRFRIKLSEQDAPALETFADVVSLVNRRRDEEGR